MKCFLKDFLLLKVLLDNPPICPFSFFSSSRAVFQSHNYEMRSKLWIKVAIFLWKFLNRHVQSLEKVNLKFSFRKICKLYLWSITTIRIFAAGKCATCINSRIFCRRVLTLLSFIVPSRKFIQFLTIKSHRFLSSLSKTSIIT